MSDFLRSLIDSDGAKMAGMIVRSVVERVKESTMLRELQVKLFADDDDDEVEHFEPYGFSSRPIEPTSAGKAESILAALGADASHYVAIVVADRRFRPTNLAEGEVIVFDDLGKFLKLARGEAVLEASSIELGDGATKGVNREGDNILQGAALKTWMDAVTISASVPAFVGTSLGATDSGSSVVKAVD